MSYQLPQVLRTSKLESLPEDLKSIAEELVAKKFGIPEVIKEGRYYDEDNIQDPFRMPYNLIEITAYTRLGTYRLNMPLAIDSMCMERQEDFRSETVRYRIDKYRLQELACTLIDKAMHEFTRLMEKKGSYSRLHYFEIRMNGRTQRAVSPSDLIHFIMENYE